MADVFLTISADDFKNDYDKLIVTVCEKLFGKVLEHAGAIVDDQNNSVKFNISDICNVLTNIAQKHRAANQ